MSDRKPDPFFLKWDFLRGFASNEIARYSGLIPVVGYLILFNDQLAGSLSFNQFAGANLDGKTPFLIDNLTRLRMLFFGGLLLLVSYVIFRLTAPPIVRISSDEFQFSERLMTSYSLGEVILIESEVLGEDWTRRTPLSLQDSSVFRISRKSDPIAKKIRNKTEFVALHSDYGRALGREWWHGQMHKNTPIRYFLLISTTLGYALIFLPSLDVTQAVVRDFI